MPHLTTHDVRGATLRLALAGAGILAAAVNALQPQRAAAATVGGSPPGYFFAVASYALGIRDEAAPGTVGEVAFFDARAFGYVGALPVRSFPFVVAAPAAGDFLIATAKSRWEAVVREYDPTRRSVVCTKSLGASIGNPNPQMFCPFKVGPDGVLWLIDRTGLHGVRWPSLRRVCTYPGTLAEMLHKIGNPLLIPIRGAVLTVDLSPLVNPQASAQAVPRMFALSERGRVRRISVPKKICGIPTIVSVRGRTVSGFTATQRFVSFRVGRGWGLTKVVTASLPPRLSHHILAFHEISPSLGVALASGGVRLAHKSEVYFLSVSNGRVLRRLRVPLQAETMLTVGRRIYLVGIGGAVTELSPDGRLMRTSTGPFVTVSAIGQGR
jgi:hypothetical protein